MRITVEPNHPLAEILGKKLLGIEIVPQQEQTKMVSRAIKDAVKWVKEKETNDEDILKALKFYANKDNYWDQVEYGPGTISVIHMDMGERATEIIKKWKKE